MTTPQHDFKPEFLKMLPTKQPLTSAAGLGTLLEAFDQSAYRAPFAAALPQRTSPRSQGAYRLGLIQMASFIRGHDCLADLEDFRTDPMLFEVMNGETAAPRTMGDFLRDFEEGNFQRMNAFLASQAKSYREQLHAGLKKPFKPNLAPRLMIDSTSHEQRGTKMEGLAWNYKDEWCLDSQIIFDELGMAWDVELRPGNTKSGVGASEQIRRAFSAYKHGDEKYLSADSAYCDQNIIKTCLSVGANFTITLTKRRPDGKAIFQTLSTGRRGPIPRRRRKKPRSPGKSLPRSKSAGSFGAPRGTRSFAFLSWSSARGAQSSSRLSKATGNTTAS